MLIDQLRERNFEKELEFTFSRSAGAGGQNVNKVNTKAELRFNVLQSSLLSQEEKQKILATKSYQLTASGEVVLQNQSSRSQIRNKEAAIAKFYVFLASTLKKQKKRKPTRPHKNAIEKRLTHKKRISEVKYRRKKPLL